MQTLKALVWAIWIETRIRRVPLGRLCRTAGLTLQQHASLPNGSSALSHQDLATARAVRRLFEHWPFGRGACLREALVLGRLLRYRDPMLCIGVRRHEGVVLAHAWLDFDGLALDPWAADYLRLSSGTGLGVAGESERRGL